MKVKWDSVTSLLEPRCIISTAPLRLRANYLDKLVCSDLLGNSAGHFPPSYCQTAHVILGCFTWSFCRQWFVHRVCASCSHGASSSTETERMVLLGELQSLLLSQQRRWPGRLELMVEETVLWICSLCLLNAKVVLPSGSPCITAKIKCLEMSLPSSPLDYKHINNWLFVQFLV